MWSAIVDLLDQNYHYVLVATQISNNAELAQIPYTGNCLLMEIVASYIRVQSIMPYIA